MFFKEFCHQKKKKKTCHLVENLNKRPPVVWQVQTVPCQKPMWKSHDAALVLQNLLVDNRHRSFKGWSDATTFRSFLIILERFLHLWEILVEQWFYWSLQGLQGTLWKFSAHVTKESTSGLLAKGCRAVTLFSHISAVNLYVDLGWRYGADDWAYKASDFSIYQYSIFFLNMILIP